MSEALGVALVVPKCVAEEALAPVQPVFGSGTYRGCPKRGCFHSGAVGSSLGHAGLLGLRQHEAVTLSGE